jgi:hypothetical protein
MNRAISLLSHILQPTQLTFPNLYLIKPTTNTEAKTIGKDLRILIKSLLLELKTKATRASAAKAAREEASTVIKPLNLDLVSLETRINTKLTGIEAPFTKQGITRAYKALLSKAIYIRVLFLK